MKTKILEFLKKKQDFVSGQAICEQLGVSRTAVWKCINGLREDGYEIESVTRKGYRLLQSPDILTKEELRERISPKQWPGEIHCYPQIDSTNEEAKRQAESGAGDGSLYVADCQTAGRGRRGRTWLSPAGKDIFFSILLRPRMQPQAASMLTLVTALAAAKTVEQYGGEGCQIKWPNDIVLHGKKLCGILTEMSLEMGEISYLVIGVGFNMNRMEFDEEISHMATSLKKETGKQIPRADFLADFLAHFSEEYEKFSREQNLSSVKEEYEKRLVNIDREVLIEKSGKKKVGLARGINEQGELLVCMEDGATEAVCAGEVSVRGLYGYV